MCSSSSAASARSPDAHIRRILRDAISSVRCVRDTAPTLNPKLSQHNLLNLTLLLTLGPPAATPTPMPPAASGSCFAPSCPDLTCTKQTTLISSSSTILSTGHHPKPLSFTIRLNPPPPSHRTLTYALPICVVTYTSPPAAAPRYCSPFTHAHATTRMLFHQTTEEGARGIMRTGFDLLKAKGGLVGRGIYFCTHPKSSFQKSHDRHGR